MTTPTPALQLSVQTTNALSTPLREALHKLYAKSYRQANRDYLDTSLNWFEYIALACDGERLCGFSLGRTIECQLSGFQHPQWVSFGGLACVDSEYRRGGLFAKLATCLGETMIPALAQGQPLLAVARAAHPVGFRSLAVSPNVLPHPKRRLSSWNLTVANELAAILGISLRPDTLIVEGSGRPIGYPEISVEASPDEWRVFDGVDRNNGDSLLGLAWFPHCPEQWLD